MKQCRLVKYDEYNEVIEQSFDGQEVHVRSLYLYFLVHSFVVLCVLFKWIYWQVKYLAKKLCWCHFNLAKWEFSFDHQEDVHVHVHPQKINCYSHEINM